MVTAFRDLFRHQAWADAAMLDAVGRHDAAAGDEQLLDLLHHVLLAHRFWLHLCQGLPFDPAREAARPDSLEAIAALFRATQAQEDEWLSAIDDASLERLLETPHLPGRRIAIREALSQVVLHSQGHRSQCAARLRSLGGEPPATDFIIWANARPRPAWVERPS